MTDRELALGAIVALYLSIVAGVVLLARWGPGPVRRTRDGLRAMAGESGKKTEEGKLRLRPVGLLLVEWLTVALVVGVVVGIAAVVLAGDVAGSLDSIVTPDDRRRLALAAILAWSLILINIVFAGQLIDALLPRESENPKKQLDRMGFGIGVLERLLVVVLTLTAGPANISLVIAAKSLARFRQLNKQGFAERYLAGTLASVTIALVSALIAQQIWYRVA